MPKVFHMTVDRSNGTPSIPGGMRIRNSRQKLKEMVRDSLSPDYLLRKYARMPLASRTLMKDGQPTGEKTLAQDCSVPVAVKGAVRGEALPPYAYAC